MSYFQLSHMFLVGHHMQSPSSIAIFLFIMFPSVLSSPITEVAGSLIPEERVRFGEKNSH